MAVPCSLPIDSNRIVEQMAATRCDVSRHCLSAERWTVVVSGGDRCGLQERPARVHDLLIVTELSNKWQQHAVTSVVTVSQLSGAPWLSAVETVMVCRSHSDPARRRPKPAIGICQSSEKC